MAGNYNTTPFAFGELSRLTAQWLLLQRPAQSLLPTQEAYHMLHSSKMRKTMSSSRADVEKTLRSFQEMISKYQFMEVNTTRRASGLKDKIPDIQKTLETAEAEALEASFELNDTLYAKASIGQTDEVYLWLGANVMLAYPIPEAETLLKSKLDAARSSLANCEEDLDFLREQITTMEVATARVYNWDVGQRRKEKDGAAASNS
ncbi:hypothetical protein MRB53_038541 [Persea americana]|nr:hypothetical protein MRB53_038541 [Persea americana]